MSPLRPNAPHDTPADRHRQAQAGRQTHIGAHPGSRTGRQAHSQRQRQSHLDVMKNTPDPSNWGFDTKLLLNHSGVACAAVQAGVISAATGVVWKAGSH